MKQFTLSRQNVHVLIVNLGGKTGGNDIDDLRKVREGRDALRVFCADYVAQLEAVAQAARDAREEAEDGGELSDERERTIARQEARAARRLNTTDGAEEVLVRLEDAVHASVRDRWKALTGWPGSEVVQDRVLTVTEALDGAVAVAFDEDAKAWVPATGESPSRKLRALGDARPQRRA